MRKDEIKSRAEARCWANIGVLGGNRSCPELKVCGHCRECPVITAAADELLARFRPTDILAPAAPTAEDVGQVRKLAVVSFAVAGQRLAVEVERVVEVGDLRPIRRVPHRNHPAFLGLVNVRGSLEPCFRLQPVLGLTEGPDSSQDRLLVLRSADRSWACLVRSIALFEIDSATVAAPPKTLSAALDTHVRGILRDGNSTWAWLDVDKLIRTLERSMA